MKVLITGANGFIAQNLQLHLSERKDVEVISFTRHDDIDKLNEYVPQVDFIFHLAGINRPQDPKEFTEGNAELTQSLVNAVVASKKSIPIIYTSSTQAALDNPYGVSKRVAEDALLKLRDENSVPVYIFRLPNVFGKWSRPNYNSAVATFCHNIARDLPIQINNPDAEVTLVYVDDVVKSFIEILDVKHQINSDFVDVSPAYQVTVGQLASLIETFKGSRETLITEAVGEGFTRALYSTYLSFLPPELFAYNIPKYEDPRGVFSEMLKTKDSGQFSFFTAHPGITRGGHYHHTKTEKFLVIRGTALFRFKHMLTGEYYELSTSGSNPQIVETVPGWTHDITNTGDDEMIVMLWANEIFDRDNPDTYACVIQ